jgi:hypothetical protein
VTAPTGRAAVTVLVVAMFTACSSGSSGSSNAPSSSTPPARSVTPTTVAVPEYDPAHNARGDVTTGPCTADPAKGWTMRGSVHNSASAAHRFSITVDFVTVPGNTVVATEVVATPRVAPTASVEWTTPAAARGAQHLACVIRQALWT